MGSTAGASVSSENSGYRTPEASSADVLGVYQLGSEQPCYRTVSQALCIHIVEASLGHIERHFNQRILVLYICAV